jgi:MFS family permease
MLVYPEGVKRMEEMTQSEAGKALPIVSVITFLGFLDTHLLIPVMALYASEIGAGAGMVGLVVGLYSLTNTPANIWLGRLVDRFGYKLPLVLGLVGDAVGMFLYTACRLPVHLALVRMFHGISGGVVGPATMSAISHHGDPARQGKSMAFYGMSLAAATLVGYGLSGFIASGWGYKAVFLLGGGLLLVGVVLALWLPGNRRHDYHEQEEPRGDTRRRLVEMFRRRGLLSSYITIFAQYFTFGGVVTLLPLYVKELGMEAFHVGMMLAAFAVMFILMQMPVGSVSDRFGRRAPVLAGLGLGIIALLLLPAFTSFASLIAVMAVYGVAYGAIFPSVSAMVADHASVAERGLATGIFHALLTSGVAIGAPVMGWVGGATGIQTGMFLIAGIMVLALIGVVLDGRRI